jgi:catechol 2,3-dioxygenase-like lactoylglutathione lyase family enzyme
MGPVWTTSAADHTVTVTVASVSETLVPILRVADGYATARWYERLGFSVVGEHRFADGLPLYLFLQRGDAHLHLSEHAGDARPGTLLYFYVDDVDTIAVEFDAEVTNQPWAREIELTDPDGNRWRIGTRHADG